MKIKKLIISVFVFLFVFSLAACTKTTEVKDDITFEEYCNEFEVEEVLKSVAPSINAIPQMDIVEELTLESQKISVDGSFEQYEGTKKSTDIAVKASAYLFKEVKEENEIYKAYVDLSDESMTEYASFLSEDGILALSTSKAEILELIGAEKINEIKGMIEEAKESLKKLDFAEYKEQIDELQQMIAPYIAYENFEAVEGEEGKYAVKHEKLVEWFGAEGTPENATIYVLYSDGHIRGAGISASDEENLLDASVELSYTSDLKLSGASLNAVANIEGIEVNAQVAFDLYAGTLSTNVSVKLGKESEPITAELKIEPKKFEVKFNGTIEGVTVVSEIKLEYVTGGINGNITADVNVESGSEKTLLKGTILFEANATIPEEATQREYINAIEYIEGLLG